MAAATTFNRSLTPVDSRVLRAAALAGRSYIRWPEDRDWLDRVEGIGPRPVKRLNDMTRRGSLAHLARGRWLIMPSGAASLSQAGPPKLLLVALLDGRGPWYLGFASALADHQLTDESVDELVVAIKGKGSISLDELSGRPLRVVNIIRADSWQGVERERIQGQAFGYRSTVERTLLDTLDYPRYCGQPEMWVRAWERAMREDRVNLGALLDLVDERSATVKARLGFWLRETGRVREARYVLRAIGVPLTGRVLLDSSNAYGDGDWRRDRETGLIVNIPPRAIDGWLSYGK
jgi:predicted transcriptional regulator of viral defense system